MLDRFATSFFVCAIATLAGSAALAQPPISVQPARVLELDMQIDSTNPVVMPPAVAVGTVAWRQTVRARLAVPGAAGGVRIRVHFATRPVGAWTLRFMTVAGLEVERAGVTQMSPGGDVWSDEIPDIGAIVELQKGEAGQMPGVSIDYAYHVVPMRKQSVTEPNQLMPIGAAPLRVRKLSKPVARLRFILPGQGEATCTATSSSSRFGVLTVCTAEIIEEPVAIPSSVTINERPVTVARRRTPRNSGLRRAISAIWWRHSSDRQSSLSTRNARA